MEVAPLVPRVASNKSKKKRPGFRPVGKSKAKSNGASAKTTTPQPLSERSLPTTGVDTTEARSVDLSELEGASAPATEASHTTVAKEGTRKRKQSTNISVGLTVRKNQLNASATQESQPTRKGQINRSIAEGSHVARTAMEAGSTEDLGFFLPQPSARGPTALVGAENASIPASSVSFDPQEGHLLERLASENPEGVRLGAFCSSFKGKKQPRTRKGTGTNAEKRANSASNTASSRSETNASTSNKAIPNPIAPHVTGAPVVKIVDGEIVLQESSLVVPGQRRTVQEVEEEFQDVVEEDTQLAIVGASYNSFVDRKGPQHWNIKETERFFEALRQMGTDFCSMEAFFENRTRKQLKRKYRQELNRNPALVEMALDPKNKAQVDLSIFDVVVDPKAIEEAAKDEPPPYIPTDMEDSPAHENDQENAIRTDRDVVTTTAVMAGGTKQDVYEDVVEEDAEAERRDSATAATAKSSVRFADQDPSIWPTVYGKEDDSPVADNINLDDFGMPEPSMDDFFNEQGEMVDPPVAGDENVTIEKAPSTTLAQTELSLIPSRSNTKAKKPKFRTMSRKKR